MITQQPVKEVFNQIAEGWYNVRHWPLMRRELEELARRWQQGKLLNVGCAHGPDFLPFKMSFEMWGLDCSSEMIRLGRKYARKFAFEANLAIGDAGYLPYTDNSFDWAIAVATYHHIKGSEARENAFRELRRVLQPGGEALLTVWNHWQPRFWFKPKEVAVPWKAKSGILYRYYYLFSYAELKQTLQRAGFEIVSIFPEKSYHFPLDLFSRNICALVRA